MSNVGTKLKAEYQIGASHRKQGRPIVTKDAFISALQNIGGETDHDLILDLYRAYSNGYRASVPAMPLSVGIAMDGAK